jgi:Predicted membrane protein (DUF2339)
MYVVLALAVAAVALLAAKPVLSRDLRRRGAPAAPAAPAARATPATPAAPAAEGHGRELDLRRLEWGEIGVRSFSWIAATGLVLAAVVLLGRHGTWPPPASRVLLGLVAGVVLLAAGERRRPARYRSTADALLGAALGILFATFYAALPGWRLPILAAAILFSALALAARRDSPLVPVVGLIGGFAMPALLPAMQQPVLLFLYLLVLNAGMAWIALRRQWPALMVPTIVFTALFEWTWVLQFLTLSQLPLAAAVFAALAAVGTSPLWYRPRDARPESCRWIAIAAAHLPLLFALYLVTVPNYGERYPVVFGFLLVVDAGLLAIAWRGGPRWLHAAGGIATLLVFWLWLRLPYDPGSWPWSLLWLALFIVLYLLGPMTRLATHDRPGGVAASPFAVFAALLFSVFIGLARRQPHSEATLIPAMLALLALVLAVTLRRGRGEPAAGEEARRGRPVTAAIAVGLAAIALMTLHPPLPVLLAVHALLLAALLAVAWVSGRHLLAVLAIPFYVAMVITASYAPDLAAAPALLLVALVPYLLFVAYPLAAGGRSGARAEALAGGQSAVQAGARAGGPLAPYVAAVLASLVFFAAGWTVRNDLADAHRWWIGFVPLLAALAMLLLLWRMPGLAPPGPLPPSEGSSLRAFFQRALAPPERRLTLVAAAALAFASVAIVMLLPKPWAVCLWALEAAALAWLSTRLAHDVLAAWSTLLAAAVFLWLAFDADLYEPWRFVAVYTVCGAAMIAAAFAVRRAAPALWYLLSVAGLFELWFLINLAIANGFHAANGAVTFDFVSTPHAADALYTIAWAVIATGLLIAGYLIDWRPGRHAALALLLATVAKCLANDLPRLRGLALAASLLGLALSLAVVGVVLQKQMAAATVNDPAEAA